MGRRTAWVLGTGFALALFAMPASAQAQVQVGVRTPNVGIGVIVGAPRPRVIEPYYEPVFVPPRGRRDRERDRDWAKRER
jgi:hypothetical protein